MQYEGVMTHWKNRVDELTAENALLKDKNEHLNKKIKELIEKEIARKKEEKKDE
jgi:regulator of replication initiation timing